tara:strand:+ start:223 stop:711 length:489 start_codon:yes stop_codon:yes gene_type:complete
MKIAFLHGLESRSGCDRVSWLKAQGHEVYNPQLFYAWDSCYERVTNDFLKDKPDLIIGSSMGGWFAWNLGKDFGIPVLLLNPAMHSRTFDPEMEPVREQLASKVYVALGREDKTIDPVETVKCLTDFGNINQITWGDYGHRTPLHNFKIVFNKLNLKKLQVC